MLLPFANASARRRPICRRTFEITDVRSRIRDGRISSFQGEHDDPGLPLRLSFAVATRGEREHKRAHSPVLPQGHHLNLHSPEYPAEVATKINARPHKSRNWEPSQALRQPQENSFTGTSVATLARKYPVLHTPLLSVSKPTQSWTGSSGAPSHDPRRWTARLGSAQGFTYSPQSRFQ